jgi:hypothetical protein
VVEVPATEVVVFQASPSLIERIQSAKRTTPESD